jgi:H+/Cl- antiporter ClcA
VFYLKRNFLGRVILGVLSGILSGLAATVFLYLLSWATDSRESHQSIIWLLPLAGFFIGWVYHRYGKDIAAGNNLILDEIHDPKNVLPVKMAPFILLGTVITHLFGGSAGREGTAVQMGASLSDQLSKYFKIDSTQRKMLLAAGAGAGFGAAIGTPWAGVIFGMEVIQVGKIKLYAWLECLIASFAGYYTALLLKAPHSIYPKIEIPSYELHIFMWIAFAGILFGLSSRIFILLTHSIEHTINRFISYPPLKPFLAGILLALLYYAEGSYRYDGLGIQYIQEALGHVSNFKDPGFKTIFTALTIGSGFKGGEFIPLVFIGTTLGSALSIIIPISFQLLAAVGFAAVFGGASNTPIACSIMAMEIFGYEIAPYAIIACFMSYYFSGHKSIYKSQRIIQKKYDKFLYPFKKKY